MEAINKYRKESENYVPNLVRYNRSYKHLHSHQRFVVPWQMEDVKSLKDKERD